MSADEFAAYAEIYDAWVATAPITVHHVPFYVEEFVKTGGACVELGVGNGRITVEAARRGVDITGVDVSPAMLALCRRRAEEAGVAQRVKLIEADMRSFRLPAPASLITIPFSSIGHVTTLEGKAEVFRQVHSQLAPGGRFVFDTLVYDPTFAEKYAGAARLRSEHRDPATGEDVVLWVSTNYDVPKQGIRIVAWADRLDADGVVKSRRYCRMNFSWIEPTQTRGLLEDAGFTIEECFGKFDRTPLTPESKWQIWVAHA
jgi:SAM-dependent methyltransferase